MQDANYFNATLKRAEKADIIGFERKPTQTWHMVVLSCLT